VQSRQLVSTSCSLHQFIHLVGPVEDLQPRLVLDEVLLRGAPRHRRRQPQLRARRRHGLWLRGRRRAIAAAVGRRRQPQRRPCSGGGSAMSGTYWDSPIADSMVDAQKLWSVLCIWLLAVNADAGPRCSAHPASRPEYRQLVVLPVRVVQQPSRSLGAHPQAARRQRPLARPAAPLQTPARLQWTAARRG
jgi:hypothetical protein